MDDLIFGRNAVTELLKSGRSVNKIFVAEGMHYGSIQKSNVTLHPTGAAYRNSEMRR